MTLEEKLIHLQETSMKQARMQGNEIIAEYKSKADDMYSEYEQTKKDQFQIFIEAEKTNVEQSVNKALAYEQLKIKQEIDQKQLELKEKLLEEIKGLLIEYKAKNAYAEHLKERILKAKEYAKEEELKVYIDPSDKGLKENLEKATGVTITISERPFFGGMRAVIPSRNVLMEESFESRLKTVFSEFNFKGGQHCGN